MNSLDVYRRLKAYQAGMPLPRGTTKRLHLAAPQDLLIVAFLRMGGESRPWGVAWGPPGRPPRVETVPEARDRTLVAGLAARLAPDLLAHLRAPGYGPVVTGKEALLPLLQVWLPNLSHLEMLHHLAYAFTFARNSAPEILPHLRALGRACGWLFRDAQRPGAQHVGVATRALSEAFTFPAEDVRQGHLGYLLAWLEPGSRAERMARAQDAERRSVATTLEPAVEREQLDGRVSRWREGQSPTVADEIHEVLEGELTRRFRLTEEALEVLRRDPRRPNRGLGTLVERAAGEQWWQYLRTEQKLQDDLGAFVPSPETDRNPAAAAERYLTHAACEEELWVALLGDDDELLAEVLASGDGFRGRIEEVRDLGVGRSTRPVWVVRDDVAGPLRLRVDSRVCVADLQRRTGQIRDVSEENGTRRFEVEITGLKTARSADGPPPASPQWEGRTVTFIGEPAAELNFRKAGLVWDKTGPGAWLTHRNPQARPDPVAGGAG